MAAESVKRFDDKTWPKLPLPPSPPLLPLLLLLATLLTAAKCDAENVTDMEFVEEDIDDENNPLFTGNCEELVTGRVTVPLEEDGTDAEDR